ncbi:MAG: cytochrome c [Cytophagales bacterium]|nr:MAG: cytochrome c [Cytophagales bacterium]
MNHLLASTLFLSLLVVACNTGTNQQKTTADSTQTPAKTPVTTQPTTDSLTLDLARLQAAGQLTGAQTVRVPDDPVFHQAKSYRAVPLRTLLEQHTTFSKLDPAQTQIVFECEDGYNPSMSLDLLLKRTPYLAIADLDAPKGQAWVEAVKNGEVKKVAPFYVVYPDVKATEHDYKWPYNLARISLVQTAKEYAAIYPHDDDTMVKGFGLFQKNCGICHALNGVGGKMGPELNYPKSVTEYWRSTADIKAFVQAPASYRNECKMPAVTYLADKELDEIMRYLTYMALHKQKPS